MKRKDAIEYITSWLRYGFGLSGKAKEVLKTAVKSMAELEKGSCKLKEGIKVKCEDVVSRDAVIKAVDTHMKEDGTLDDDISCILEEVSPVQLSTSWIPVSKRLPNKEGTYLLWGKLFKDEDNYCFIGDYDEGCEQFGYWQDKFVEGGYLGSEFYEYESVIAWMPFPESYKESGYRI